MKTNNKIILVGLLGLILPAHAYTAKVTKTQVDEIGRRHSIQNLPTDAANMGLIVETENKDVYAINPTTFKKLRQDAIQDQDLLTIELLLDLVDGAAKINRVEPEVIELGAQDIGGGIGSSKGG
ncbi:MAG: hypothetical protein ABL927_03490 [Bdellovibrionales bacterium]